MLPHTDTASAVSTTRPESPLKQYLDRAAAGTAAARAELIALPNGTQIRMRVAEQMERRARQPVGPALARRLAAADGTIDVIALDGAICELRDRAIQLLALPVADKRQPAIVRSALEGLSAAVASALTEVRR